METRTLLAVVLSIAVLAGFQYFFGNQITPPPGANVTNATRVNPEKEIPLVKKEAENAAQKKTLAKLAALPETAAKKGKDITIETPYYKAVLSENGATFKHFILKKYRQTMDEDSPGVELVNVSPPILPLGVQVTSGRILDLRTRFFQADKHRVDLTGPRTRDVVIFTTDLGEGARLKKTFTFHKELYRMEMAMELSGAAANDYTLFLYNRPYKESTTYVFSGPSYHSAKEGLKEVTLKEPGEHHEYIGNMDWLAYGDNYFMMAVIPEITQGPWKLIITRLDKQGTTQSSLNHAINQGALANGSLGFCKMNLYFGPKEINRLKEVGHNLEKAINFGWFDPIAKPLLYVLNFFYKYIHNYGWAIILLTVAIKIAFWPLAHKSAQSMKTMQKLQPKLKKLKEKYGDDKERMNKELMQLYKTYKVNPMSGCLPMVLQIPVFFALYKVLLQAIELRHAPFLLWINDLSAPDRLMIPGVDIPMLGGIPVLTLLMGASMYFQQKMSPSSLDPTQAKMMQLLPVVFTFMFINFPSGLVLYWLVNNILSIVQQYYVNKFTD
ncbi:MAG: membrane protein insertase YidC [Thermodesulfatator sp.]|nr:MAG: membrane protein insertase YidC [Thermodesulfatator sp.]